MDNRKRTPNYKTATPKTISIILSPEDQDYVEKIAKQYGINKTTDCLRLALRVAVNQNNKQPQTT